jgi:hypothetical protein
MDGRISIDDRGVTVSYGGMSCHPDKRAHGARHITWEHVLSASTADRRGVTPAWLRVNTHSEPSATTKPRKDPLCIQFNHPRQVVDMKRLAEEINRRVGHVSPLGAQPTPAAPPPPPPPSGPTFEKLRLLGELRDAGVLSPEEFERARAHLLRAG